MGPAIEAIFAEWCVGGEAQCVVVMHRHIPVLPGCPFDSQGYNAGGPDRTMRTEYVNPITEHQLFLKLFITNGGGW